MVNFDNPGDHVISPAYLAHVVLRTKEIEKMVDFYVRFLGGRVTFRKPFMAFVTYDQEHHRVALIEAKEATLPSKKGPGLEHFAFTFSTLSDLLLAYRQRLQSGIKPVWCINHGPTTSMYYEDPDGNTVEAQVENFDTTEEISAFMNGPNFEMNPIGTDFDPEDLIKRLQNGEEEKVLKTRLEIGARGMPE